MKALILAGGFGTRLRPLSCTRPKLMFPIANRKLLDWIIEGLSKEGVTKVILAVNYMAENLKREFGTSKYGIKIEYSHETKPLGTGGPIKKAEKLLNEEDEPFFVLNGDIISSISYSKLYEMHKRFGGEGTIALHQVEDPTRFGVVELNKDNLVKRFIEKPSLEEAPSNLVNAGVYVLNHSILDRIHSEKKVSIEKEVFPQMSKEDKLYGYQFKGLWIDTGKPEDYFKANMAILNKISDNKPIINKKSKISSKAKIIPPSIIGKEVTIEDDAYIGPYASIGDYVSIGKGARIQNAIIFPRSLIEKYSSIKGAIIGEEAIIGSWVKIEEKCIIGDHVIVNDNVTITQNVKICHNKAVDKSILQTSTIM